MISADLPSLLQSFFTDRLLRQRQASPRTIEGNRDCFRLLLHFAKERLGPNAFQASRRGSRCALYRSLLRPPGKRSQK